MPKVKGEMTRQKVLDTAMELINTKGFHHTSISDIIAATGVKKGNLYFHFASKEDLGLALIKKAKDDYLAYLNSNMKSESPLGKITDILMAVLALHRSRNFVGGCIFGNIALEMSDDNQAFAAVISEVFDEWTDMFAKLIKKGQQAGEIASGLDPKAMGRHIVATMEGAIMMAKLDKNEQEVLACIQTLLAMLNPQAVQPSI